MGSVSALTTNKKLLGSWGEEFTAAYLRKRRWKIVGMNFSTRFGEIDVIAENRKYVAFVEVKLRKNADFGAAREFVTPHKQEHVRLAAMSWLSENPTNKQPRFDVAEIYAPEGVNTKNPSIEYYEDAFN